MIKYYYKIPKCDLVYNMVKYSMTSLGLNQNPSREELVKHKSNMRLIKDRNTFESFIIVKMGIDFSTPFKGISPFTKIEISEMLNQDNWEHNQ